VGVFNTDLIIPEAITFAGLAAGEISLIASQATLSGQLTLTGPTRFDCNNRLTITGGIGEMGGAQTLILRNGPIVFAAGSVIGYTGPSIIEFGAVRFDGTGPAGPISLQHAVVGGSTTVGAISIGPGGGSISPAFGFEDPVSTLTTQSVVLPDVGDAVLSIIHFLADGQSDRLSVHGTVQLAGRLSIPRGGNDPTPPFGNRFRIIDNDGSDPILGIFFGAPEGTVIGAVGGRYLRVSYHGGDGNDVDLVADALATPGRFAVGAGAGGGPIVNCYDGGGVLLRTFPAYDLAFHGGVRVATVDFNSDGVPDILTGPGPGGGPHVKIFDGFTGRMLAEFNAFDPAFRGGVFVAAADLSGDVRPDIVISAGAGGGPFVRTFSVFLNAPPGSQVGLARSFLAYDPRFLGGVSVAAGDIDGDGRAEIITGPGVGGGPDIRVFDSFSNAIVREFLAYDPSFTGGVFVAAGDVDGDFGADVITSPGAGGGPHIREFSGLTTAPLASFFAYDLSFTGGVAIAAVDATSDGHAEIVTGAGSGGGPHVRVFNANGSPRTSFFAFDPAFIGGVFVG
jgi:hypothetical protein